MELRQIEAFVRVAWCRSYTRASRELGITQPAVSARIAGLENELGMNLFTRVNGKTELTPSGKEYLPYAEEILRVISAAEEAARSAQATRTVPRQLHLGSNTATAAGPLAEMLRGFRSRPEDGPPCSIEVAVATTPALMSMLMEGEIELAFASPVLAHPLAQVLWRRKSRIVLVASPDYPDLRREYKVSDLAEVSFVDFRSGQAAHQLRRIEQEIGTGLDVVARSNSAVLVRALVARGLGLAFVPIDTISDDLGSGRLVSVDVVDYEPESWEVVAVRWRDRRLTTAGREFVAFLESNPI